MVQRAPAPSNSAYSARDAHPFGHGAQGAIPERAEVDPGVIKKPMGAPHLKLLTDERMPRIVNDY